ncbi:hypothetical protein J7E29_13375 [Streptomyces sp. ISL-90]|nr:hypothetical protein [Streptomyces sp. ISL-90]
MKTAPAITAAALLIGGSLLFAAPAFAEDDPTPTDAIAEVKEGVCDELDSGKIDLGSLVEYEITAPEGFLITEYCVKAGSIVNGEGPEYVLVDPPAESVTISHSSGKDISHYSFAFEAIPTPTPTPDPTPTPSDPPAGGGDGGAKLAETGFESGWLPFVGIGALALGAALVAPRLAAKRR